MYQTRKKTSDIAAIVKGVILIAIVAVALVTILAGKVKVDFYEMGVDLQASLTKSEAVGYDAIETIEIVDNFKGGTRVFGVGTPSLATGSFTNDELGDYKRFTYAQNTHVIIIRAKDKNYVINDKDVESTDILYNKLVEATSSYRLKHSK